MAFDGELFTDDAPELYGHPKLVTDEMLAIVALSDTVEVVA